MYLTFNISDSKRKARYHINALFVFKKDFFRFMLLMTPLLDGWLQGAFAGRQAGRLCHVIHWPVCSLSEDSRTVFGNMREGGATNSLEQRRLLKLQAWLANVAHVKRQDVLASLGTFTTPLLSETISWCLSSLSARANAHKSMWLDVLKQEGSCQVSVDLFSPTSYLCLLRSQCGGCADVGDWEVLVWVHPSLELSRWVSLGKLLYLCLGLTDCEWG